MKKFLLLLLLSVAPVVSVFGDDVGVKLDRIESGINRISRNIASLESTFLAFGVVIEQKITGDDNIRKEEARKQAEKEDRIRSEEVCKSSTQEYEKCKKLARTRKKRTICYSVLTGATATTWVLAKKELKEKEAKLKTVWKDFFTPGKCKATITEYPDTSRAIIVSIVFGGGASIDFLCN
jgi:hypothetical protein